MSNFNEKKGKCISGDCSNGIGTFMDNYGSIFNGSWKNGKANGKGIYTTAEGDKYEGEWEDDCLYGYGKVTFPNGDVYKGNFHKDLFHGEGTYKYSNGAFYMGEYKNNKREGQGLFMFPDGAQYSGEFKNDLKHGFGKYETSDGKKFIGTWESDKFIKDESLINANAKNRQERIGKSDSSVGFDETDPIQMNVYEIKDRKGETFLNDTYVTNDDERYDFEKLKNLDQFVSYKCIQKLKKLTINPFYFQEVDTNDWQIKDIAPLSKIKNLEELFFADKGIQQEAYFYSSVSFPNIKKLKVAAIYDCRFLLNFPNVESLTLDFVDFFGNNYKLPEKVDISFMKNLKTLEILNCPAKLLDEDKFNLDDLVNGIAKLEHLEKILFYVVNSYDHQIFFYFKLMTSQELSKLNKLKTFIFIGDFNLHLDFVLEIPNLKTLKLDKYCNIIDKTILDDASFKIEMIESVDPYIFNLGHDMA